MSGQDIDRDSRLESLEKVAQVAAETLTTIEDWLGQASTREAAEGSIRRLWRALQAAGFGDQIREPLGWRGVLLRAMDCAGIGYGEDDEIRIRSALDRPWMWATGPRVRDLLEDIAEKLPAIEGDALCPRCAREQMDRYGDARSFDGDCWRGTNTVADCGNGSGRRSGVAERFGELVPGVWMERDPWRLDGAARRGGHRRG